MKTPAARREQLLDEFEKSDASGQPKIDTVKASFLLN